MIHAAFRPCSTNEEKMNVQPCHVSADNELKRLFLFLETLSIIFIKISELLSVTALDLSP